MAGQASTKKFAFIPILGATIVLETLGRDGGNIQAQSTILGAKAGAFLALELPTIKGTPITSLAGSKTYAVKYSDGAKALWFKSRILSVSLNPTSILFLAYPTAVSELTPGSQIRPDAKEAISALLFRGSRTKEDSSEAAFVDAVVTEVSDTGCVVITDVRLMEHEMIIIAFTPPGEKTVKRMVTVDTKEDLSDGGYGYSLKFVDLAEAVTSGDVTGYGFTLTSLTEEFQNLLLGLTRQLFLDSESQFNSDLSELISELAADFKLQHLARYKESTTKIIKEYIKLIIAEREETTKAIFEIANQMMAMEEEFLGELMDKERGAFKTGLALDQKIRDEVEIIRDSFDQKMSLTELKASAIKRLDLIRGAVRERRKLEKNRFKDMEERVAQLQSNLVTVKEQVAMAEERAEIDDLTQIHNRRALNRRIREEVSRFQRYNRPCSFVMFDVDHFKAINDRCGHLNGDQVLQGLAEVVKENIRTEDFFARFGGEEFFIILPENTLERAHLVAEKLRKMVSMIEFNFGRERIPVTISLGVASLRPHDTSDDIISRADNAMLLAKRGGRNQTRTESELTS
ncbi:MAG: diguanylate cyclase [Deltaproteobacteria bacterium]|nr:diguanylate cyclase [Deltaproteobacteria bacterium]